MRTFLYLSLFVLSACTSVPPDQFVLQGKIGHLNAPAKVFLSYMDQGEDYLDSAVLNNGEFVIKGKLGGPVLSRIVLDYDGEGMQNAIRRGYHYSLYIDRGKNIVVSKDSLHRLEIKHSPINDQYENYNEYIGGPIQHISALMNEKAKHFTPEQFRDKAVQESLNHEFRRLLEERRQKQLQYVREYPASFFSLVALSENQVREDELSLLDSLFSSLSSELQNSSQGKAYAARLTAARNTAIGNIAPDFAQLDTCNRTVHLSDFRGKYLLLDFWASWCGPCRAENPFLTQAYARYKEKDFEILGVSLDSQSGRQAWLEAIRKDGVTWPQVSDLKGWNNQAALLYGIRAIPQNYLLDPEGKIIAKDLRGENLLIRLKEILEK